MDKNDVTLLFEQYKKDEEKAEIVDNWLMIAGIVLSVIFSACVVFFMFHDCDFSASNVIFDMVAYFLVFTALAYHVFVIIFWIAFAIVIRFLDNRTNLNFFYGKTNNSILHKIFKAGETTFYLWNIWAVYAEGKEKDKVAFVDGVNIDVYPKSSENSELKYFFSVPRAYSFGHYKKWLRIRVNQKQYIRLLSAKNEGASLALTEKEFLSAKKGLDTTVQPILIAK